jgi:hypothetical protein
MDPYLESHWGDLHTTLMVYARNQLNAQLPDDLQARVEESLAVIEDDDPMTLRHLEIVDTKDGSRVVTAIEILSPANKVGSTGQLIYIQKQRDFLDAKVNLVEIDLIRAGNFVLAIPENRLPSVCRAPYMVCIRRATRRDEAELYPMPLRQPLPNIPVPLRPSDQDVVLPLQPLLDACYRDGRYDRIDYGPEPVPRLGEADARWADSILREAGRR